MNALMRFIPGKLGAKINAVLVLYFLFALAVIQLTIYVAQQLEGGAAAINDAGSQRMRTYQLANLLHERIDGIHAHEATILQTRKLVEEFETILSKLEHGDPDRPLFLPREDRVQERMRSLRQEWDQNIRPQIETILVAADDADLRARVAAFDLTAKGYVASINDLVLMVERSNARYTDMMYLFQNALVGFSLIGTFFLIYLFNSMVIRPVDTLKQGMERMAASDLGVRLSVQTQDEFGELAAGFNRMADHLEGFYATLEQRVQEETSVVEEKNRELALLYEVAAYLGEPASLEAVCNGVLLKLCRLLGAPGGVVRLVHASTRELEIVVSSNMSEAFNKAEARMAMCAGLCGGVAVDGSPITRDLTRTGAMLPQMNCILDGYVAMAAIPIRSKKQVLGVLNLFFREQRVLALHEIQLLEAIGQHLGVAIENLRLVVREKEMAVSEERNLLAQELHDSIAQALAFLNIQAQMLQNSLRDGAMEEAHEELARMREGIQESYDDVRELLVHFRIKVNHANLDDAIRSALEKFEGQTGIRTSFNKQGEALAPPEATSVIQILHIIQESLSNVRKHAAATSVEVAMRADEEFIITVRDDGQGFDPKRAADNGGSSVGIGIMRERAHRIGARLDVSSAEGRGTCVTLALPR